MDPDQCIEVVKQLGEIYRQVAYEPIIPPEKMYNLQHILTELEICIIGMRAHIRTMKKKIDSQPKKPPKKKKKSPHPPSATPSQPSTETSTRK